MYPGMMYWWRLRRASHGCGAHTDCGPFAGEAFEGSERERWRGAHRSQEGDLGAGAFGVRRPLRFLAYKLDLDEHQVGELASILNDLKTERAQAEVDGRRAMATFADAVSGERFDAEVAQRGGSVRVTAAEHLRDAVTKALGRLHALLDPEQRERLAYLIRTGVLQM